MKKILALTILSLLVLSCKKDKLEPTPVPANSYTHVNTVGSYWVYEWYDVDANGNETLSNVSWKDTMRIVGDTIIHGKVFQHYKGKYMNQATEYYSRDSSGYVINPDGSIVYSYVGMPMHLRTYSDQNLKQASFLGTKQTISTNFGNKEAYTTYLEVSNIDGTPVNSCGDLSVRLYNYYVSGLGCTGTETGYIAQLQGQCAIKRSKLITYHIVP